MKKRNHEEDLEVIKKSDNVFVDHNKIVASNAGQRFLEVDVHRLFEIYCFLKTDQVLVDRFRKYMGLEPFSEISDAIVLGEEWIDEHIRYHCQGCCDEGCNGVDEEGRDQDICCKNCSCYSSRHQQNP